MTAYLIAHVDVTNPEQYEQYKVLSTLAMQAHNVKLLVRGGQEQVLEGDSMKRTVIMEFPSMSAAQQFYESEQYRQARQARDGAAIVQMCVIEGL